MLPNEFLTPLVCAKNHLSIQDMQPAMQILISHTVKSHKMKLIFATSVMSPSHHHSVVVVVVYHVTIVAIGHGLLKKLWPLVNSLFETMQNHLLC